MSLERGSQCRSNRWLLAINKAQHRALKVIVYDRGDGFAGVVRCIGFRESWLGEEHTRQVFVCSPCSG